jgi:hypothetical protein
MDRFATILAAAVGLTVTIGPATIAQIVPRAADLKLAGVCLLGTLITISACARR